MENKMAKWGFKNQKEPNVTIRDILEILKRNLKENDQRPLIHLGHGDPSSYPSFRTTPVAEQALFTAIRSSQFNGYAPSAGISAARRPGYPLYEAHAAFSNLEVRHFDLLPEKGWEIDLDNVEALADDNTIAMVVINPGNPCGNVFTFEHMQKIAETAKRIGVLLIADEVYNHLVFGRNQFVPMGTFGSVAPMLTVGTISKRWLVPGWRFGWIAVTDPNGVLNKSGIAECIQSYLNITADPATPVQGAIPEILKKSTKDFFSKTNNTLREAADACYAKISEIPSLTCPHKPEGAMSTMLKINLPLLEDVKDDMDFASKLATEESGMWWD
ncbi:hypothetical protein DH2020_031338 [Rehmannia glutinosa]|uniref:Aminotransferase class I/classII large domain-containing protein n=1 Tax=Rehmannia glutinosa TaxID=99300 RepID=A0ABR0VIB6_REHGL